MESTAAWSSRTAAAVGCAPDISWARPLGETLRLSVLPPRQEVRMSVTARTRLSRKICGGSGRGVAEFSHCTFCQASPPSYLYGNLGIRLMRRCP